MKRLIVALLIQLFSTSQAFDLNIRRTQLFTSKLHAKPRKRYENTGSKGTAQAFEALGQSSFQSEYDQRLRSLIGTEDTTKLDENGNSGDGGGGGGFRFSEEHVPLLGVSIGFTGLLLQIFLLYPWHLQLSHQFEDLQVSYDFYTHLGNESNLRHIRSTNLRPPFSSRTQYCFSLRYCSAKSNTFKLFVSRRSAIMLLYV